MLYWAPLSLPAWHLGLWHHLIWLGGNHNHSHCALLYETCHILDVVMRNKLERGKHFCIKFHESFWLVGDEELSTQSPSLLTSDTNIAATLLGPWSVAKLTSLVANPSWLFLENSCKVQLLFIIQNSSKDILNQLHRSKGFSRFFLIVILILSLQILTRYQCTKCSSQCTIYWQGAFTAQGSVFMFLVFSRR